MNHCIECENELEDHEDNRVNWTPESLDGPEDYELICDECASAGEPDWESIAADRVYG